MQVKGSFKLGEELKKKAPAKKVAKKPAAEKVRFDLCLSGVANWDSLLLCVLQGCLAVLHAHKACTCAGSEGQEACCGQGEEARGGEEAQGREEEDPCKAQGREEEDPGQAQG